jgi:hypothetical protein
VRPSLELRKNPVPTEMLDGMGDELDEGGFVRSVIIALAKWRGY